MPRIGGLLLSYCGLVCEFCPAYRSGDCPGCDSHAEDCEYIKCARGRGLSSCMLCREFPCELHEEGFAWPTEEFGVLKWRVYSEVFLDVMKKVRARASG